MKRTNIGGQAVLEGVMMRGNKSMATAVRTLSGEITVESKRITPIKKKSFWYRLPIVRGVLNFVSMLFLGTSVLLRSSEAIGEAEEPTKFEKWLSKKLKVDLMQVVMVLGVVLGLILSISLFFILPQVLASLIFKIPAFKLAPLVVKDITEGFFRLAIFVGYVLLCTRVEDVKRVFMYHGAEHKTINAFESGVELTVENVQKQSTVHNRCGTTFMFLVMVISIILFSITGWLTFTVMGLTENIWTRIAIRLLLLPLVAGISYEILKLLALSNNIIAKALRWPGLLLQKLTTKEPDDDMVETAIVAFNTVFAMDNDDTILEKSFEIKVPYKLARKKLETILPESEFEKADIDWILCDVLHINRNDLLNVKFINEEHLILAEKLANERAKHIPLQYILGYTSFYGINIIVSEDVLIPRPETELLAEQVIKVAENKSVLDLCTGSGAIAIAIKLNAKCNITGVDISEKALDIAKYNANINNAQINFINSNLFENINDKYDIIVSNPPYIATADINDLAVEVKGFEPKLALDGGNDGLEFYRKIAVDAKRFLNENGILMLEVGVGQAESVKTMLLDNFKDIKLINDYNKIPRIIIAKI